MAINRDRKETEIVVTHIGDECEEYTVEEIYKMLLEALDHDTEYKENDITRWVVYAGGRYGSDSMSVKAYRWETDTEMGSRITAAEMREKELNRKEKEKKVAKEQQEYEHYQELKKKYDGE